jgi:hypothetical protein
MEFQGWKMEGIEKDKERGIYFFIASPIGCKDDFEETKNWKYVVEWTGDSFDVDDFAVISQTINKIRKKVAYLYILSFQHNNLPPWDIEAKFDGGEYPKIEVDSHFGPSYHEGLIEWSKSDMVPLE